VDNGLLRKPDENSAAYPPAVTTKPPAGSACTVAEYGIAIASQRSATTTEFSKQQLNPTNFNVPTAG